MDIMITEGSRTAGALAHLVSFLAVLAALILAVHVAFDLLDADPSNEAVQLFARLADRLAPGVDHLFRAGDPKVQETVGYGLAATAYLVVGQVLSRLLRRTAAR